MSYWKALISRTRKLNINIYTCKANEILIYWLSCDLELNIIYFSGKSTDVFPQTRRK